MAKSSAAPSEEEILNHIKAVSHPIRIALLRQFKLASDKRIRKIQRGASPTGIISAWKDSDSTEPPISPLPVIGVVAYHVRMLCEYGVIVLAREEPRRGAVEHFYVLAPNYEKNMKAASELLADL